MNERNHDQPTAGTLGWKISTAVLAVLLIVSLLLHVFGSRAGSAEAVATVNGVKITKDELFDEMAAYGGSSVLDDLIRQEVIRQAVEEDREAIGYARAAALGACSFCKLMASRGMVYKTAGTAGEDANERFLGEGTAKYHNWCSCSIIPVFRGQRFELSPHAARWDEIYREYAQGYPGEQLRRFRRALAEHDEHPLPGSH